MAQAIHHGRLNAQAIRLLLAAAALLLVLAPACLHAQEPGQPETPAPDASQPAPDAAPADDQSQDQQSAPDANQPAPTPAQGDATAAAAAIPPPDMPKWPINEKPGQAAVTWDAHGLAIQATNSSLQQIMKDIATATGASVEGLNKDERVFGEYGPGQARDVLSQLLLGAGYNVIMIGDRGQGAPRQILLSLRHAAGAQNGAKGDQANNNDDDSGDNDVPEEQPAPAQPPVHPGFPGGPPRTPQQMMQERQERLQQMRQQQMQQSPQPNPQ